MKSRPQRGEPRDEQGPQSFSWARRWSASLNLLISVAAVLALVAMVNYLAIRHFTRFHWNKDTEAALSTRTREVLATLTNQVKVIVYFNSEDALFPRIKGLLKEYQFASPRIEVQYVDYLRDGAAARKVKQDYKLTAQNDRDVVIFDANGSQVVANSGGLPGVWSARFAGDGATYEDNVARLLADLAAVGADDPPSRRARFRTVALVRFPDGREVVADGVVEGHIAPVAPEEAGACVICGQPSGRRVIWAKSY